MGFEFSPKVQELRERLGAFMSRHVYPNEDVFWQQLEAAKIRWGSLPIIEELKTKAKAEGL
jgi:acyl-CoA dehydrogenase